MQDKNHQKVFAKTRQNSCSLAVEFRMNFETEFSAPFCHEDIDSWVSLMTNGMPNPQQDGIGQSSSTWIPVASEKLTNPVSVPVETQENQLETDNWKDLIGMYTGILHENTDASEIVKDINQPPGVRDNGNQYWAASATNGNSIQTAQTPNRNPCRDHISNQASNFNRPLTSGSQQTQRFTSNNLISKRLGPNDGFPVTYGLETNPCSRPKSKPDAKEFPIIQSFPIAPITPDTQSKIMNSQQVPEKANFSEEETWTPAKSRRGNQTVSRKGPGNLHNELLETVANSPPSAVSTTQKDYTASIEKDEQGVDLNKTPHQKTPTRRKKHRPRVIKEGTPKRTPTDPKSGSPGGVRVKRKYVRRKGVENSDEKTPVKSVEKRKYVRRKGVSGSNEETPADNAPKIKYVRRKGVDPLESQQTTVDDTSHTSCKKRLNFESESVTKDHDSKYSQQDVNVLSTPLVKPRHHGLNVLARNMATSPTQDIWKNGCNSLKKQLDEGFGPTNLCGMPQSFTGGGVVGLDERRGVKRRSWDQTSHATNSLVNPKMLSGVANPTYSYNGLSSIVLENQKKMKLQSGCGNVSAMQLLNSSARRIDPSCKVINVGENGDKQHFCRPLAASQYFLKHQLSNERQLHLMKPMPEISQKYTQGAMISWNPPPANPLEGTSRFSVTIFPESKPNSYNHKLNESNIKQHPNNSLKGYQQSSKVARGRGRPRKQKVEDSVDDITHRLERLQISDGNKKQQNELVLYRGSGAIVPFELIKKRKKRAKVDLDPESERLWNLLMGSDGSEGAEKLDEEKEKWWENERRVFRGRADSFIARMHLVLGDRRFSRWKGSVVDSVIGVFLTQNVTDHLSSSAFMSLAARFPLKSTSTKKTCCQSDIMKCHEKIASLYSSEYMTHQISTRYADKIHGRVAEEVNLSQDSFDSSTIQIVDEYVSSSGSNSEADDVTAGFKTFNQLGIQKKENTSMLKDHLCNNDLATNMHHSPQEPVCNMHIPRMNGNTINLNSSFGQFRMSMTQGLPSSHSGVTEAYHTSNASFPRNGIPKFQTSSQDNSLPSSHLSHLFSTNQHATESFNKTTHGSSKQGSTMFGGIPIMSVEEKNSVVNKQNCSENSVTEGNSKKHDASRASKTGSGRNMPKARKETPEYEIKNAAEWESLRKQVLSDGGKKERSKDANDTIDYEAVRRASVEEISDAIRERGMNNLLADRMKSFLNRLVRDHGSVDLEWLRDAPQDKAKEYLLSFWGLGIKSVECVRLLTLHHLAFPVDTNVGRIAVRLGWVPLQPLPESLQLHLLEMYPVLESIQKYLWPRLCKLDQLTLYELHYQMITFGKVFCTKSKPNCNACPMRAECRHFASAFASARLALPEPEEKRIVTSDAPVTTDPIPPMVTRRPMPLPPAETESFKNAEIYGFNCEPIIEEPATPEPDANELSISDIEDQYYEDSDEIPCIKLNMEEFTTNLQNIMQDSNDMSKALVASNPQVASIPTPKLKDVSRLRTEHLVYELPDSHQLLNGLDKREPDDPSPYLLAIWTPGETANSAQPPKMDCSAQRLGQLCDRTTCFSCNSVKEASSQVVRGTILIPCRTATRGSFPLNGTYFQVNEMFTDHASSLNPINVPRAWIWNLPRRKVYFGTSVTTIFKGLIAEEIQYCFWKGFVCVRGFDRINRAPKPLIARLHFPVSKLTTQKTKANK